jgi:ABC-2 type transport system permease protein
MKLVAKKRTADELGKETDVPIADFIDVGVLDDKGEPIALERRKFDAEEATVTLVVASKPAKAGIDPLTKLIDRKPNDNTVTVTGP